VPEGREGPFCDYFPTDALHSPNAGYAQQIIFTTAGLHFIWFKSFIPILKEMRRIINPNYVESLRDYGPKDNLQMKAIWSFTKNPLVFCKQLKLLSFSNLKGNLLPLNLLLLLNHLPHEYTKSCACPYSYAPLQGEFRTDRIIR